MHNTELSVTEDYSFEIILAYKSNFNIKICKNLGLRFLKLKLAYHLRIFPNLSENRCRKSL